MQTKPRIVIILGPTAVGKTHLSLDLAETFGGEIVSADSMQVYRHLDIGTSKPSRQERGRVPHHLIDVVNPDEEFSAARFNEMAGGVIGALEGRKAVFVVGGTGLYLRTLTGGLIEGPDEGLRKRCREALERQDSESLHGRLRQVDPAAAGRIHPRDKVRIVRALETVELTGEPISEKQRRHGFRDARYAALKIGLYRDREELYRRIDGRAEQMVQEGLVGETENILRMGYDEKLKPLQTLGYRYVIRYLKGGMTLEEALRSMQRDTRHYARRQMTWFRREPAIEWFHPSAADAVKARIAEFLNFRRGSPRPGQTAPIP
ncbi:MAG TPA: tRNA (adenosine(37)-N6)-dimethylallyltransferase MiaA [Syntrophales bacterium]|nr:tRNA (adenosine(37)-N6)-dimethylallyltransferase MiaA [Syntrophales bacterium]